jgi:type I restriction enzyme, S subunit
MNTEQHIIPELRFPGFDEPWVSARLGDLCRFSKGKGISKEDVTENGKTECVRYGELYTHYNEVIYTVVSKTNLNEKDTILSQANDILIPASGETQLDIARASCLLKEGVAIGGDINILKTKLNGPFLSYYLNGAKKNEIATLAQGISVVHLYSSQLQNIIVHYPLSIIHSQKEQQRIAACLSSLDEVITAHSEKLEALKAHKKGLMQNLFPQEGETVPKFRFPEFAQDGEWEFNPFSHYIVLYRGSSPRPIQEYLTDDDSGVNWIKIGDTKKAINSVIHEVEEKITVEGAKKSRPVKHGELILANSMSFGKTYELAIEGCIYDGWFVLREYEKHYHKPFLLQLLNSEYMQNQYKRLSAGGIVQNISSDIVYNTALFNTSLAEQQKIATCLSALDASISAQTEKIDQLKQHKQGLMQGLFPKMED